MVRRAGSAFVRPTSQRSASEPPEGIPSAYSNPVKPRPTHAPCSAHTKICHHREPRSRDRIMGTSQIPKVSEPQGARSRVTTGRIRAVGANISVRASPPSVHLGAAHGGDAACWRGCSGAGTPAAPERHLAGTVTGEVDETRAPTGGAGARATTRRNQRRAAAPPLRPPRPTVPARLGNGITQTG